MCDSNIYEITKYELTGDNPHIMLYGLRGDPEWQLPISYLLTAERHDNVGLRLQNGSIVEFIRLQRMPIFLNLNYRPKPV